MHRKTQRIISYILGFFLVIFLVLLAILAILKTTILNEVAVKKALDENNYYQIITDKIFENMKDYMRSSGLNVEILNDLFTVEDVRSDVNRYLDKIYQDSKIEFDDTNLKEKLTKNIEISLEKQDLKINDEDEISSFVTEMVKIYKNETNLYNIINGFIESIQKANNLLSIVVIILLVICIALIIPIAWMKVRCFGTITIAVGLILYYIRFAIYEKIDFKNILILSKEFSVVLTWLLTKIANYIAIYASVIVVIGLVIVIVESYITMKKKRRIHHRRSLEI